MSSGAVDVPLPNVFCWLLGTCQFWHDTAFYILPAGLDVTIRYSPKEPDKVFLIFAITFGRPRDYATGEVIYTDEIGFWHRGVGMKFHWDPLVESIMNIVYPHVTPATRDNPFEIRFVNRTDRTVIMDVSIWIFEYHKKDFERFKRFIRGFVNFFRAFGSSEDVAETIRRIIGKWQE